MKKQLTIIVLSLVMFCMPLLLFAENTFSLFDDFGYEKGIAHASRELSFFKHAYAVEKFREVKINHILSTMEFIKINDKIQINLFDDEIMEAYIDQYNEYIDGTISISARLKNFENGFLHISSTGDCSLACIEIPEKKLRYVISYEPLTKIHYLMKMNIENIDDFEDSPAVIPTQTTFEKMKEVKKILEDDQYVENKSTIEATVSQTTIDIMIVYTPAALSWANNNGGGINNVIAQAIMRANTTMINSKTDTIFNLVYNNVISYAESSNLLTDLERITGRNDGYMDDVHLWRNQYNADLVILFLDPDYGDRGIAWLLNSRYGDPYHAFSVADVTDVANTFIMIHEIGHNLGAGHHIAQSKEPGPGLYTYSAGWRWSYNKIRYCDVMTYPSGYYFSDGLDHIQVAVFSNPDVRWNMGTLLFSVRRRAGDSVSGNNAMGINNVKGVVAAYR